MAQHSPDSVSTSSSLLVRAKNNEAAAWDRIVLLYSPLIFHWCRRWNLRHVDAENLRQDVMLAIYNGISRFSNGESSTFRGWIWTIAYRKYVDFVRRAQGQPNAYGGSDALEQIANAECSQTRTSEDVLAEERTILYRRAIELIRSEFSERDWNAFRRLVSHDRKAKDVAEELGMSVNAVYLAKSRIRKRLRDQFSDLIEG